MFYLMAAMWRHQVSEASLRGKARKGSIRLTELLGARGIYSYGPSALPPHVGAFLAYISNIHWRPYTWSVRSDLQTRPY